MKASASSTCATSRSRRTPPTAMRARPASSACASPPPVRGAPMPSTGVATAFRSETPMLHIGGQGGMTQHMMGSLQDLPHVDMMRPITKFAAGVRSTERAADMVSMAIREAFNGAPGPSYLEIPRDVLDREIDIKTAVIPEPGRYRASIALGRRSGRHREAGRSAGQRRAPGHPLRPAGLDRARPRRGRRAAARPGHPGLLQRRQPRPAAAE